jgi:hypothetical protein
MLCRSIRVTESGLATGISLLVAPVLLSAALLMSDFSQVGVPLAVAARPLLVVLLFAASLYGLTVILIRRPAIASAATLSVVAAAWSIPLGIVLAIVPVIMWRLARLRRKAGVGELWGRFAVALSGAWLVVALLSAIDAAPALTSNDTAEMPAAGPSIYAILLDAYPRADALTTLGYDNEPFLSALEERGFNVARASTANYDRTAHTLASMLWMRHLVDIPELQEPPGDHVARKHLVSSMIASGGPAVDTLRQRGYDVLTVPSPISGVTLWGTELVPIDHVTDYEIHLLNDTDAGHLAVAVTGTDWLAAAQRKSTIAQLEALVSAQGPGRFIFTHVLSPHPPYVFGSDGGVRDCFPACQYWAPEPEPDPRLIGQVDALNTLVLAAVDRLEPGAVIVLFSDHGHWLPDAPDPFGNLIAVRTPGRTGIIDNDSSLVTVLPRLFDAYFDAGFDIPDDRHFAGGPLGARLELTVVE